MNIFTRVLGVLLITGLFFTSCSEYQSVLKNEDTAKKYELAEKLYKEGNYKKALRLFEQIAPSFTGKPQGERVIFFYADTHYQLKDYYLAGYQFERFYKSYPKSDRAEEAAFLGAKSYYHLSPKYSIDQTETNNAIEKLQSFINAFPNSERIADANVMVRELRTKLEKKAFEIAKQYNRIRDYYAAIKSIDMFLSDYPGTPFREDAMYYKFQSMYNLAVNSVQGKLEERLSEAKEAYGVLKRYYPETKHADSADRMLADIEKQLQQFSK